MFAYPLLLPALLAILFASLSRAASLSDFTPRVSGLNGKCLITYHKSISGCSNSDFQAAANCSAKCINGLIDLASLVKDDCSDAGVDGDSLIGIFLAGQGPSTLCSNAASLSTAAPTTTSIVVRSSTLDLSTTPTAATSIQVDTSLPPTTTLSMAMPTLQSTTSPTPSTTAHATEPGTTLTSTTSAPVTTETTASNSHGNGGGDPFNLFNASPPNAILSTWLLTTSLAVCAFLAHISF